METIRKNAPWFRHYGTNHMKEIGEGILADYGLEGYGIYYLLLEKITLADDRKIPRKSLNRIAKFYQCDTTKLEGIVDTYFSGDEEYIWNIELEKLLELFDKNLKQRIEAGKASGEARRKKNNISTENERPFNDRSTTAEQIRLDKIRIDKNRIDNNRKEDKEENFEPLNIDINEFSFDDKESLEYAKYLKSKNAS